MKKTMSQFGVGLLMFSLTLGLFPSLDFSNSEVGSITLNSAPKANAQVSEDYPYYHIPAVRMPDNSFICWMGINAVCYVPR